MQYEEPKTERRIRNIFRDNGASVENYSKIRKAFDKLVILRNFGTEGMKKMNERTFILKKEEYQEKMKWINEYLKLHGYEEDAFIDINSFKQCSEDYDYYYELKSETQYKKEEEERKEKKLAQSKKEIDER